MLFNSSEFMIFFPIVVMIYYIIPNRIKYLWLLAASYYFYMCWNPQYALLMLFSTAVTYLSGLLIDFVRKRGEEDPEYSEQRCKKLLKWVVALSFTLNLAILLYFKYANFGMDTLEKFFKLFHIQITTPTFDVLLPVGISFYIFQALSYTMDVYRGDVYAEKNFFRYALFVSFFPQLVAGPIERSKNLLKQLAVPRKFDFDRAREGVLLMLWGFFLKIVLADRIAIFVDNIYGNYENFPGYYLLVATVLFAVQIYCDFAGYSTIAMGTAKIIGVDLMENFNAPYFAETVAGFWRNWHISLTSWFKDYLYIPLGGSRKGKFRKYLNKVIVFLVSGLWHGANFTFVIWGGLNGIYQVIGEVLQPYRDQAVELLRLNRKSIGHKLFNMFVTFILVDFAWIFFRADTLSDAVNIIQSIWQGGNPWILTDGSLFQCGLDAANFRLMLICIGILIFADICKYNKIKVREVIAKQDYWFRWIFIAVSIAAILTFGIWGPGYSDANFIYFQF